MIPLLVDLEPILSMASMQVIGTIREVEELRAAGFPTYDELTVNQKIYFKGLIERPGQHDALRKEFELLKLLAMIGGYREAINAMLYQGADNFRR